MNLTLHHTNAREPLPRNRDAFIARVVHNMAELATKNEPSQSIRLRVERLVMAHTGKGHADPELCEKILNQLADSLTQQPSKSDIVEPQTHEAHIR